MPPATRGNGGRAMARRIALLIPALALLVPVAPASAADPLDVAAAAAQNASDQAEADVAYLDHTSDVGWHTASGTPANVTCTKPHVSANEVQPHRDLVLVEAHQTDQVVATAECVNLTGTDFPATIQVRVEYCPARTGLTTCPMYYAGFQKTTQAVVRAGGTATLEVDLTAIYSDTHAALGKVRRAWACVRTGVTGSGCLTYDFSGTYGL